MHSVWVDGLALTMLGARIGQTLVHVALPPTNATASVRFALFFLQAACIIAMTVIVAQRAL
jgi:hypothetical protein